MTMLQTSLAKGKDGYYFRRQSGISQPVKLPHEKNFRQTSFEIHLDELGRYSSAICPERVKRPQTPKTAAPNYHIGCDFCDFEKWAEPKGKLKDLSVGWASNPFPFGSQHDVHIVIDPIHNFEELIADPVYAMDLIRIAFIRAREIYSSPYHIFWGMSFGIGRPEKGIVPPPSGASFQHAHAQMSSIFPVSCPGLRVRPIFKKFKGKFIPAYLEALEREKLVIKSYQDTHLIVPWAQQANHHLRILTSVINFQTPTDPARIENIGIAFYDALKILFKLGIKTFNCIALPAPMEAKDQTLMIDVRPSRLSGSPELSQYYIVDEFPSTTAAEGCRILSEEN